MFQSSGTEIERSFWSPFTLQFHIRESRSLESSNIVMHFLSKICFSDTNTQYVGKSVFFSPECFDSPTACKIYGRCFTFIFRWNRKDTNQVSN